MVWLILTLTYGRIAIQLNCKPMKLDHVISVLAIFPQFRMLKQQQNHIQNHIHSIWNAHIFSRFFIILRTPSVGASSPPLLGAHGSETIHVETLELCHDLHLLEVTYGTHHVIIPWRQRERCGTVARGVGPNGSTVWEEQKQHKKKVTIPWKVKCICL
jgi:hypothetical protein